MNAYLEQTVNLSAVRLLVMFFSDMSHVAFSAQLSIHEVDSAPINSFEIVINAKKRVTYAGVTAYKFLLISSKHV